MALYHFAYKHASRAMGFSARAHADYIAREGRYGEGTYREQFVHGEHHNMPAWARHNPRVFWQAADRHERANGRLYTEIELALPRELDTAQQTDLVREFIATHIGERHPVSWAMHTTHALDGGSNPHVHIMFSERTLDGIERGPTRFFKRANAKVPECGGAPKDRVWQDRNTLLGLRQAWADTVNRALERNGFDVRVDHRSLDAQGINREPEPHLGREQTAMLRRGAPSELGASVIELRQYRERLGRVEREMGEVRGQLLDLQRAREERQAVAPSDRARRLDAMQQRAETRQTRQAQSAEPTPEHAERDRKLDDLLQRAEARRARQHAQTPAVSDRAREETPQQTRTRILAERDATFEAARRGLERATGVAHVFAQSEQVRGRFIDRVSIGGEAFARLENEQGRILVPWRDDMAAHRGREVTVQLQGSGHIARAISVVPDEEERVRRPAPAPDLDRDHPEARGRDPGPEIGF